VGESLAHYQHVLRKLGVPLQQHIDSRQVAVVDLLAGSTGWSLDTVIDRVKEAATSIQAEGCGTRIIVDDLSELRGVCDDCEPNGWMRFLLRLLALETDNQTLAMLVHGDIIDDALWIRLLEHNLENIYQIEELESGHSNEVTGQISITRKEVRVKDIGDPGSFVPKQGHLYKLTDAGMRLLS